MSDFDVIVLGAGAPGEHCAAAIAARWVSGRGRRVGAGRRRVLLLGIRSKSLLRPGEAVQGARDVGASAPVNVQATLDWQDCMVFDYSDAGPQRWLAGRGTPPQPCHRPAPWAPRGRSGRSRHTLEHVIVATGVSTRLPHPRLNLIYRLEATVGDPQDVGAISAGHRRIVPLTGGTFSGPELRGRLLPGASADWQIILPDGTALGDVRYTLETERGDVLYVQSQSVRHGSTAVLERLARGEDVDAREYTFRTTVKIEIGADGLDWLNKGIFVSVGGRQRGGVIYEVYLVG